MTGTTTGNQLHSSAIPNHHNITLLSPPLSSKWPPLPPPSTPPLSAPSSLASTSAPAAPVQVLSLSLSLSLSSYIYTRRDTHTCMYIYLCWLNSVYWWNGSFVSDAFNVFILYVERLLLDWNRFHCVFFFFFFFHIGF